MKTTVINIKTDPKTKAAAQKLAKELGLTLSALVSAQLRQAIRTKTVTLSTESYIPTPYLEEILEEAERDIAEGKNLSPTFDNAEDALVWLHNQSRKHASEIS